MELDPSTVCSRSRLNRAPTSASNYAAVLTECVLGAGVARLSIQGANSTNPSEPGINHFDSGPDASATAFALQFKAGLKGEVARNLLLFAEYRHLTINPTQYTFGETLPPHLPTDAWTVSLWRQSYNLFVAGLQIKV